MDCYVCNTKTDCDDNQCENHTFILHFLMDYMAEETGCEHYTQSNTPFKNVDPQHVPMIKAYLAGAGLDYMELVLRGSTYTLIDKGT